MRRKTNQIDQALQGILSIGRLGAVAPRGDDQDAVFGQPAAGERTAALVKALGRLGIQDWQGVGDAEGEPAPLTAEGVDALLDLWPMAEAFERLYLGPALLLDDEKTHSRPHRVALRRRAILLWHLRHAEPPLRQG